MLNTTRVNGMRRGIAFRVNGTPKGQPRHRAFARKIGNAHVARVYDPGTAEAWKGDIIRDSRPWRPETPIEDAIRVDVTFFLPRPKRLMRKKDPDGAIPATCKPDRDNLEKALLDALTTDGWMRDDALVVAGEVQKCYHAKDDCPGAIVTICWPVTADEESGHESLGAWREQQ